MTERAKSQDPHWPVKSDSHWTLPAQGLQKTVQVGRRRSPEQHISSHCSTHMWAFSACSSFPYTSPAIVEFLSSHTNCIFFLAFSLSFPFCCLSFECSFIFFWVPFPLFRMLSLYFICCSNVTFWATLMSSPVPLAIVLLDQHIPIPVRIRPSISLQFLLKVGITLVWSGHPQVTPHHHLSTTSWKKTSKVGVSIFSR